MIKSFRHKGLERLVVHDDGSKLPPDMLARLRLILSTLQAAEEIEGMDRANLSVASPQGRFKRLLRGYCSRELASHF